MPATWSLSNLLVRAAFTLGPDGIYRCEAFQQFPWLRHGFGTRIMNPACDVTLRQIHSDRIVRADNLRDREEEGDALVTERVGLSIGVRTADCVPMLILDRTSRAIAAVHAGWRGTASGIGSKIVAAMATLFGTFPSDLLVALGPSIGECCYVVGSDVANRFASSFPEWPAVNGPRHLDLIEANRRALVTASVNESQIFDAGVCTRCHADQFFSFRQNASDPGRMVASIVRLS